MNVVPISYGKREASPPSNDLAAELPTAMQALIAEALERRDLDLLLQCLGQLARDRGMADVASKLNVERTNLYRMFRPGSNPKMSQILALFEVFDIHLTLHWRSARPR